MFRVEIDARLLPPLVLWWAGGAVAAVSIGWIAARLHLAGVAPIGIVSLVVGLALGALLAGLALFTQLKCSSRQIIGTAVLALVTVLAEHAWLYVDFRRQWHEARAKSAEVALFRSEAPWSPGEYFVRELTPGRGALWWLDAVLIGAAAVGVVIFVRSQSK